MSEQAYSRDRNSLTCKIVIRILRWYENNFLSLTSRQSTMPDSEKILSWKFIFLLGIVVALVVVFLRTPKPCQEPLTYRPGHIDERFGLTRWEFSMAVQRGAGIWGQALSR